jgi:hypothetical protein
MACPAQTCTEGLFRTTIHIANENHVLPVSHLARLALPLNQQVDDIASEIERLVLKVVAGACLEARIRRKASRETIALTPSHIAQKLAFSARLSIRYPDEFRPVLDVDGRARVEQETCCKQSNDFHTDVLDSLPKPAQRIRQSYKLPNLAGPTPRYVSR